MADVRHTPSALKVHIHSLTLTLTSKFGLLKVVPQPRFLRTSILPRLCSKPRTISDSFQFPSSFWLKFLPAGLTHLQHFFMRVLVEEILLLHEKVRQIQFFFLNFYLYSSATSSCITTNDTSFHFFAKITLNLSPSHIFNLLRNSLILNLEKLNAYLSSITSTHGLLTWRFFFAQAPHTLHLKTQLSMQACS